MTDELPPLPAHPVARAYDRSGASLPNLGWTDTEAAKIRAYAAAAVARERERCAKLVATHPTYGDNVQGWFDALAATIRGDKP